MEILSSLVLFVRAAFFVMQWMKEGQAQGKTAKETLYELDKKLGRRIDAAAAAGDRPHDDSVRDPYDRAGDD